MARSVSLALTLLQGGSCLSGGYDLNDASEGSFLAFIEVHGRGYVHGSDEYHSRRQLFEQRAEDVRRWNEQPNRLWTATVNHLSDWTEAEKKRLYGYAGHPTKAASVSFLQPSRPVAVSDISEPNTSRREARRARRSARRFGRKVPENFVLDASNLDSIENQGGCGSCWAFAAGKMAETNHLLHVGEHRSFSFQELVDCTPNPKKCGGTGGCEGATVELAVWYMGEKGLSSNDDAPYVGHDQNCKTTLIQGSGDSLSTIAMDDVAEPNVLRKATSTGAQRINMRDWLRLPVNEGHPLKEAVYLWGSVAVSVDGSPWSMYGGGIFNSCSKDATINHAVLCTGYGKDETLGEKFFKIANSWGSTWGEKGYIRLKDDDDHCGWDSKPQDGTGCEGGPKKVKVCGMCGLYYDNVILRFKKSAKNRKEN